MAPLEVTTIAGSGVQGHLDGLGTAAMFREPQGITTDRAGNIFVCDFQNHCIRKVALDGTVSTLAGESC